MRLPTVVLDNIRSTYNVGAIMRTADAVGGCPIVCCGITPHPEIANDLRSPVVRNSNTKAIAKTALGAELQLDVSYRKSTAAAVHELLDAGFIVLALEQDAAAHDVFSYTPPGDRDVALILGSEVDGVSAEVLELCDDAVQIPQFGSKESLNVSVAAGIALYAIAGIPLRT